MSQKNWRRGNHNHPYNRDDGHSNYRRNNNNSHQYSRYDNRGNNNWSLTNEEKTLVYQAKDELFNKQKIFSTLPALENKMLLIENLFVADRWELKELMVLKAELNETRNRLNEKDIAVWKEHTRKTNMTGSVVWGLRKQNGIEMCTNVWIKMAEIFAKYKSLIPQG